MRIGLALRALSNHEITYTFDADLINPFEEGNPVYEWSSGNQFRDPSDIIYFGGKYYFYATEFPQNTFAGTDAVGIAVFQSDDWRGPYVRQWLVIEPDSSSTHGDDLAIYTPNARVVNDTIYLFYTGRTSANDRANLYCASALNPTATFTKIQDEPILYNSTDGIEGGTWEQLRLDAATPVLMSDGSWRLYYKGVESTGPLVSSFGYATTSAASFPLGWTRSTSNPFFDFTNTFNGGSPEGPSVWIQNNLYYMVYATPESVGFEIVVSEDGVTNWTSVTVIETDFATWDLNRWHGAAIYFDGNECKGILFHDEFANNDVRQIGLFTIE